MPHPHDRRQRHTHSAVDPSIATTSEGLRAVSWSFAILAVTAALQLVVVWLSGSVALLADTVHNFGDAATAIPLGIAFLLARRAPSPRFTYGYGRAEDLAGLVVVGIILTSAIVAGYEAIDRLLHPRLLAHPWVVLAAAVLGFLGNEAVARLRIRVGRRIHSAALVADGHHARIDAWTSLAVLAGAVGAIAGLPLVDPIVGLAITAAIARIVWQSATLVLGRLLDGVDPATVEEIRHTASHAPGVEAVSEVRARWSGHRLHAEVNVAVGPELSVSEGHAIAVETRHRLLHGLPFLLQAIVHVDPTTEAGERHHAVVDHAHDGLPAHSHG